MQMYNNLTRRQWSQCRGVKLSKEREIKRKKRDVIVKAMNLLNFNIFLFFIRCFKFNFKIARLK